jgi:hypothetical protein
MGWDKGRYYTRSKKVNGRVVREYVGSGRVAELAAQLDVIEREQRAADRAALRAERAELADLDAALGRVCQEAELLARAALVAAGFRQHKRGEWRKKRGDRNRAEQDRPDRPEGTPQVPGTCAER